MNSGKNVIKQDGRRGRSFLQGVKSLECIVNMLGCRQGFWKVLTSRFHFKYITMAAVFKKLFCMSTMEIDKLEAKNRRN